MRSLSLAALSALVAGAFLLGAADDARADHRGNWYGPGWGTSWHHGHGWKRHRGVGAGATIIYGAPRTVYVERRPRVIYVDPDPVVVQSPGYAAPRYAEQPYPQPRYAGRDEERYCREVNKTVTIDGRLENAYGKACYQPDGSWQWVDD